MDCHVMNRELKFLEEDLGVRGLKQIELLFFFPLGLSFHNNLPKNLSPKNLTLSTLSPQSTPSLGTS